ncbi:MAG: hypothetical protein ABIS01_02525 [Ferruginibacter sp.]
MQQQSDHTPEPIKPDLKHDNMEYSASTEGDDILDSDKETTQEMEDEEITHEELQLLQDDEIDNQAAALNSAENDSQADEENFLNEAGEMDEFEEFDDDNDKGEEHVR